MPSSRTLALLAATLVGTAAASCSDGEGGSNAGMAGTGSPAGDESDGGVGASGPERGGTTNTAGSPATGGMNQPLGGESSGGGEGASGPSAGQSPGGSANTAGTPGAGGTTGDGGSGTSNPGGAPTTVGGEGGSAGDSGCSLPNMAPTISHTGTSGFVLRGTVVTPSQVLSSAEVFVEGDTISCVAASCASSSGYANATIIETGGILFPGLIDTHNHVLFNIFDESDWSPLQAYQNHNQWTNEARYGAMVDAKQYLNGEGSDVELGCEMDKYGELKGLIGGTTSMVGAANPANKACYGSLTRTIDQTPNGLADDKIQVATLFPNAAAANGVCTNFADGDTDAYLIHIAEGVDASALKEFTTLGTVGNGACLYSPKTTIVHGTALGDAELNIMAQHQMSLVWTPQSNVSLYGAGTDLSKTTNIPLARSKGINVALSPDWSLGGSINLLDELRFANHVDDVQWGDTLSAKDLTAMVTTNAAHVLGLDAVLGSIAVGRKADLLVIGGDRCAPYDSLLAARPEGVRLVMVGGKVLYGDSALQAAGTGGCEALNVCSATKFVCVAAPSQSATDKLGQKLSEITSALGTALTAYDALNLTQWDFAPLAPLVKCQ